MNDARMTPEALLGELGWLRGLARALSRDPVAADDLAQEGLAAALSRPPQTDRPVRPWLAATLRNLALFARRTEGRRARRDGVPEGREVDEDTPERLIGRVQMERLVAGLVLALDEPYRTTVLRRYRDERTSEEIAREQGVPAATVRWRLAEGLSRLRAALAAEGVEANERWAALLIGPLRRRAPARFLVGFLVVAAGAFVVALVGAWGVGSWRGSDERASGLLDASPPARLPTRSAWAARAVPAGAGGKETEAALGTRALPPPRFAVAAETAAPEYRVQVEVSTTKDGVIGRPWMTVKEGHQSEVHTDHQGWSMTVIIAATAADEPACAMFELRVLRSRPDPSHGGTTLKKQLKAMLRWCGEEQLTLPSADDEAKGFRLMGDTRVVVSIKRHS